MPIVKPSEQLSDILKYADELEQRGRKSLSTDLRQDVYDFWKVNSTISVHRSNNRHPAIISEENFETSDIQGQDISKLENGKFWAHHLVSMKPYRELHEIYCQISVLTLIWFISETETILHISTN